MNIEFDKIESYVINKIFTAMPLNEAVIFREQYNNRQNINRKVDTCGWYAHFCIPNEVKKIANTNTLHIGDVVMPVAGMETGIGFILHISDGYISCLESYTYGEYLPASIPINFANGAMKLTAKSG
ncbi:MAG: hypothetical protein LBH00_03810 [Planctomycetaceae bacterium]|jgi:hypothetical protein|nr:hypothetical protein [Planctomycetaceae bacterium]